MSRVRSRRLFRHGLLPQLLVFEAVARLGSVTRAAEELHLAQPTVSLQLKKLAEAGSTTLRAARAQTPSHRRRPCAARRVRRAGPLPSARRRAPGSLAQAQAASPEARRRAGIARDSGPAPCRLLLPAPRRAGQSARRRARRVARAAERRDRRRVLPRPRNRRRGRGAALEPGAPQGTPARPGCGALPARDAAT